MAIPPLDISSNELIELTENCFIFHGTSLEYLKPFKVFEEDDPGTLLKIKIEEELIEVNSSPTGEIMPGSISTKGSLKVYFTPAKSGSFYLCQSAFGSCKAKYLGPDKV